MDDFKGANKLKDGAWLQNDRYFTNLDMFCQKNGIVPFLIPTVNLQDQKTVKEQQQANLERRINRYNDLKDVCFNIRIELEQAIAGGTNQRGVDAIRARLAIANQRVTDCGVDQNDIARNKALSDDIEKLDKKISNGVEKVAKLVDIINATVEPDLARKFNNLIKVDIRQDVTFGQKVKKALDDLRLYIKGDPTSQLKMNYVRG